MGWVDNDMIIADKYCWLLFKLILIVEFSVGEKLLKESAGYEANTEAAVYPRQSIIKPV